MLSDGTSEVKVRCRRNHRINASAEALARAAEAAIRLGDTSIYDKAAVPETAAFAVSRLQNRTNSQPTDPGGHRKSRSGHRGRER